MKRTGTIFVVIATIMIAGWSLASKTGINPMVGERGVGGSFWLAVVDSNLGTTWELVDADTGFTQLSDSARICVAYAYDSWLDSLRESKAVAAKAVWGLAATTDTTQNINGLNTVAGKYYSTTPAMATATGVFANAYSGTRSTYAHRGADTDFRLGTANFSLTFWLNSKRTGNPSQHEVVFSTYTSPQAVWAKIVSGTGTLRVMATYYALPTDSPTRDSVTTTADLCDSTWHLVSIQRRTNTLVVYVDQDTSRTGSFSATGSNINADTVQIGALRTAKNYPGLVDEFWYRTDTLSYALLHQYFHEGRARLSLASDSAKVKLTGVRTSDSTVVTWICTVGTVKPCTTVAGVRMWRFEQAWMDSTEDLPLLVYSSNASPRTTKLDSIPAYGVWNPIAHKYFDKNSQGSLDFVHWDHLAKSDSTMWELRLYPDMMSLTKGYEVKARGKLNKSAPFEDVPLGFLVPQNSYVAVYAKMTSTAPVGAVDTTGSVVLRGRTR